MTIFTILISVTVLLMCFLVPSLLSAGTHKTWLGLKRFVFGVIAVGAGLFVIQIVFEVSGLRGYSTPGFVFLWLGTAMYWMPLLMVRVIQLAVRERRQLNENVER